jgi:hypothetical protein
MKLFDIKVFTSNREYDITLRNLTIIRVNEIVYNISIACKTLLRSIKRLLIPSIVVIQPQIRIRSIKSLQQRANVVVDAFIRLRSLKRATVDDALQIAADGNISSKKRMTTGSTWRVIADALIGSMKPVRGNGSFAVDANMRMESVRKRRLGEVSLTRLADMDPMTLDDLDYVVVHFVPGGG